jgi:hypothetical protein
MSTYSVIFYVNLNDIVKTCQPRASILTLIDTSKMLVDLIKFDLITPTEKIIEILLSKKMKEKNIIYTTKKHNNNKPAFPLSIELT